MNEMLDNLRLINPRITEESLEECAEYLKNTFPNAVDNYLKDESNYGLLFHIAGYNGEKQQELQQEMIDMFNVEVF